MLSTRTKVMLSFVAGGAIGAGIALLYAPYSGAETRKKIKDGALDVVDGAKTRFDEGVGKLKAVVAEKKEDLKAAIVAGKDAFNKGVERLEKTI